MRLAKLERERAKAREAYYADGMPLEQFRAEQQRINREIAGASAIIRQCQTAYEEIEASVDQALSLCADAHALYVAAPADMRRMLNQAVFSEMRVRETIVTGIYTDGFAALRGSSLTEELAAEERRREARHDLPLAIVRSWETADVVMPALQQGQGSEYAALVGGTGIEPVASSVSAMPGRLLAVA